MGQLCSAQVRESLDGLLNLGELLARESAPAKSRPRQCPHRFHRTLRCQKRAERSSRKVRQSTAPRNNHPDQWFTPARREQTFSPELKQMPLGREAGGADK